MTSKLITHMKAWLYTAHFPPAPLPHCLIETKCEETHTSVASCLWNDTLFCSHLSFLYSVSGWGTKGLKLSWVIKPHIFFLSFFQNVFSGTCDREGWQIRQGGSFAGWLWASGGWAARWRLGQQNPACHRLTRQSTTAVTGSYDWWYYVLMQDLNASTLLWFNPRSFIKHPGAADVLRDDKSFFPGGQRC